VERTTFAERYETKGYAVVKIDLSGAGRRKPDISFVPLPARLMLDLVVKADGRDRAALRRHLQEKLAALEADAIVRIRFQGPDAATAQALFSAAEVRAMAPYTMNVVVAYHRG
jgi:hypothetical protein